MGTKINNSTIIWFKNVNDNLESKYIELKGNVDFVHLEADIDVNVAAQSVDMYTINKGGIFSDPTGSKNMVHTSLATAYISTETSLYIYDGNESLIIHQKKSKDRHVVIPNSMCCESSTESPLCKIEETFKENIILSKSIKDPLIKFEILSITDSHGNFIIKPNDDVGISLKIKYHTS